MKRTKEIVPCPHCGGEIEKDAKACVHCGSDERTGWSDNTYLDGLDLPDEEEYETLVKAEFNEDRRFSPSISWKTLLGLVLLIAFLLLLLRTVL